MRNDFSVQAQPLPPFLCPRLLSTIPSPVTHPLIMPNHSISIRHHNEPGQIMGFLGQAEDQPQRLYGP